MDIPIEFQISKKNNETEKMWKIRQNIYNGILEDTKCYKKAKVYSNIVINKIMLNCDYSQDVNNLVQKYYLKYSCE